MAHVWMSHDTRCNTHCNTLQHTIRWFLPLMLATLHAWESRHTSEWVMTHVATHCNTLQHTATHCNTLQHTATHYRVVTSIDVGYLAYLRVLQHIRMSHNTRCNTLQHTAPHFNILHRTTAYHGKFHWCWLPWISESHVTHMDDSWRTLQYTTKHCTALQHTATHYRVVTSTDVGYLAFLSVMSRMDQSCHT